MFIESPRYTERFGSIRMNHVQRVVALDSGRKSELPLHGAMGVMKIEEETIKHFEDRMAIVIPVKDEKLKLIEGVISGVPHDCLVIVVSNSQIEKVDRFRMEGDALNQLCRFTLRQALIAHQKDPAIAEAAIEAGYNGLLGEDGLVRNGKSEAMIIGLLMAKASGKEYVGFIDADNYFPGAVLEYVRNYAAGFSLAQSSYSMVRILWLYKPKISGGVYFKKWGRVSETTNKHLNHLISSKIGFETEVVKTGNAGEHAMSMKLAEIVPYASGYAVEPQELISIFENFGGILSSRERKVMEQGVDIFQIETRNPHLHEEKGEEHLDEMLLSAMSTIYHSPLCGEEVKEATLTELVNRGILKEGEEPPLVHINAPLKEVDTKKFIKAIQDDFHRYQVLP
ncbi:MAG: mannosyl-3-phosphoglycerate synthase [Dehalococcoidia bacterium]|nr:mannosyl-3-phosphoglycerate synthase [Dehalococcoidia bacterium]